MVCPGLSQTFRSVVCAEQSLITVSRPYLEFESSRLMGHKVVTIANTLRARTSSILYDLDTYHWATYTHHKASHHIPACTATWMAINSPDGEIQC